MGTIVNVAGISRAGTTIMDLILGNAEKGFSCGEVYARFRPYRIHHFSYRCGCGCMPCAVWNTLLSLKASEFHAGVCTRLGKDFVVDSSKDLNWIIDNHVWASQSDMKIRNILMWKTPESLAWSHYKRSGQLNGWRQGFVGYYRQFLLLGLPFVSVCLDDFIACPAQVLPQLCGVIDVPYFEGKEYFWTGTHHHLFGSASIRRALREKQGRIEPMTSWPAEFTSKLEDMQRQLEDDAEVQDIMARLRLADVANASYGAGDATGQTVHRPYPFRYYARQLKGEYKRWFPEPFVDEAG